MPLIKCRHFNMQEVDFVAKSELSLDRTNAEKRILDTYIERLKIGAELNRLRAQQIRIALDAKIDYGDAAGHCW